MAGGSCGCGAPRPWPTVGVPPYKGVAGRVVAAAVGDRGSVPGTGMPDRYPGLTPPGTPVEDDGSISWADPPTDSRGGGSCRTPHSETAGRSRSPQSRGTGRRGCPVGCHTPGVLEGPDPPYLFGADRNHGTFAGRRLYSCACKNCPVVVALTPLLPAQRAVVICGPFVTTHRTDDAGCRPAFGSTRCSCRPRGSGRCPHRSSVCVVTPDSLRPSPFPGRPDLADLSDRRAPPLLQGVDLAAIHHAQ